MYALPDTTIQKLQTLFSRYPQIHEVILFGSRAKGEAKKGSDIDLALKGENITFDLLREIEVKIDDLDIPYRIDLIDYNTIENEALKEHIDTIGITFKTPTS